MPSGIVILVSPLQYSNDELPMLVTLPSLGITLFLHPTTNVLVPTSIKQLPLLIYFVLPSATAILSKPIQPANADSLIFITLSGIVMLVRLLQPLNV